MAGLLLTVTGLWAYALTHLTVLADRPAELIAGAAVAAAVLLAVLLAGRPGATAGPPARSAGHGAALRARARRRGVPRQVDPDAAGRPRPRAPGLRPSAG
ncbi:DUF6412 domain-containing protein [Micromonospora sp. NBC_01655]|uniref:DUF6412 domain-containing protein n=1 Tax=Micromonospora sp. NBC_01655 TaxID=2975983 RepID=UPI002256DD67|nr:DUF6412 domain-containing protein [Micromonospora sp. NBC_01655]MCX4470257.1 DUF6412 domain-containing protein [Micromonospora sp. NBC_01655]